MLTAAIDEAGAVPRVVAREEQLAVDLQAIEGLEDHLFRGDELLGGIGGGQGVGRNHLAPTCRQAIGHCGLSRGGPEKDDMAAVARDHG